MVTVVSKSIAIKRNYPESLIIGTLAGAATLGLMIPLSFILIVYGVSINESITKLFLADVFPGLVLAIMFMIYVAANSYISRKFNPTPKPTLKFTQKFQTPNYLFL